MKKKFLILLVLFLFIGFVGCKEDTPDIPDEPIIDDNNNNPTEDPNKNNNLDPNENNENNNNNENQDPINNNENNPPEEIKGVYNVKILDKEEDINWANINKANIETYKWVESDTFNSFAQLVFVKDYGFICKLSCEETNPYVQYYNDGEAVYKDSAMEFFVSFDSNLGYINLETNSVPARLQQYSKTLTSRVSVFDTIPNGIKVEAAREGDYWTLLIRLTLDDIAKLYPTFDQSKFTSGFEFTGNFYKIGTNPTTNLRHYGMWKEVGGTSPNFHQPADFGKLILE